MLNMPSLLERVSSKELLKSLMKIFEIASMKGHESYDEELEDLVKNIMTVHLKRQSSIHKDVFGIFSKKTDGFWGR